MTIAVGMGRRMTIMSGMLKKRKTILQAEISIPLSRPFQSAYFFGVCVRACVHVCLFSLRI
jgi:hypothetical protein